MTTVNSLRASTLFIALVASCNRFRVALSSGQGEPLIGFGKIGDDAKAADVKNGEIILAVA